MTLGLTKITKMLQFTKAGAQTSFVSAEMKAAKNLFFEINEAYGKEVCDMLKQLGYQQITLKHDIYGKERMVYGAINC